MFNMAVEEKVRQKITEAEARPSGNDVLASFGSEVYKNEGIEGLLKVYPLLQKQSVAENHHQDFLKNCLLSREDLHVFFEDIIKNPEHYTSSCPFVFINQLHPSGKMPWQDFAPVVTNLLGQDKLLHEPRTALLTSMFESFWSQMDFTSKESVVAFLDLVPSFRRFHRKASTFLTPFLVSSVSEALKEAPESALLIIDDIVKKDGPLDGLLLAKKALSLLPTCPYSVRTGTFFKGVEKFLDAHSFSSGVNEKNMLALHIATIDFQEYLWKAGWGSPSVSERMPSPHKNSLLSSFYPVPKDESGWVPSDLTVADIARVLLTTKKGDLPLKIQGNPFREPLFEEFKQSFLEHARVHPRIPEILVSSLSFLYASPDQTEGLEEMLLVLPLKERLNMFHYMSQYWSEKWSPCIFERLSCGLPLSSLKELSFLRKDFDKAFAVFMAEKTALHEQGFLQEDLKFIAEKKGDVKKVRKF